MFLIIVTRNSLHWPYSYLITSSYRFFFLFLLDFEGFFLLFFNFLVFDNEVICFFLFLTEKE